jgi:hypothetical protein
MIWWTPTSIGGRRPRRLPTMMEVKSQGRKSA